MKPHAYTIPHSLRSYGICSGSAAAHRYRFATHSFNGWRCCPIPSFAQTSFVKSFASSLHSHVASKHRCFIDYSLSAVRRGTRSIAPMTAAAALLSSFVRTVLTWRHRTVTSNCKQSDDTSTAVSPLIARTTPIPLRSRRHHLHYAQPRHHRPSQCLTLPKARDRCCRGVQYRQADLGSYANDLTAHSAKIGRGSLALAP